MVLVGFVYYGGIWFDIGLCLFVEIGFVFELIGELVCLLLFDESVLFEYFILFVLFVNCMFLFYDGMFCLFVGVYDVCEDNQIMVRSLFVVMVVWGVFEFVEWLIEIFDIFFGSGVEIVCFEVLFLEVLLLLVEY